MKGKKSGVLIILAVFIFLFAAADGFLYIQGKKSVEHVKVKEADEVDGFEGEKFVINDRMGTFTVTGDSKKITADTSIPDDIDEEKNEDEDTNNEDEDKNSDNDGSNTGGDSGYIFEDSDSRYLKDSDLKGLSKEQLRMARNELYARHGYIFGDEELAEYFNGKDWYTASIKGEDFNDNDIFNKYEIANRNLIIKYEAKKKK